LTGLFRNLITSPASSFPHLQSKIARKMRSTTARPASSLLRRRLNRNEPSMTSAPTPATSVPELVVRASRHFTSRFGQPPRWLVTAPGRVNLIGEHTDYNDGFVLPFAIDRRTVIAAAPSDRSVVRIQTDAQEGQAEIGLQQPIEKGQPEWADYVRGVLSGFQQKHGPVPGFDAFIVSDVPPGGGLSSSAALEVATATLLEAINGVTLDPVEKALLCQQAEHQFAGVPCGLMDQMASELGQEDHLLLIDCRLRTAQLVPFADPAVTLLVINTNVRHTLAGGEYAMRRAQCESAAKALGVPALRDVSAEALHASMEKLNADELRRARHVVTEIGRTLQAAEAIRCLRWEEAGALMYASHDSLRDDFQVSCNELDVIVELARKLGLENGVYGCRMTGGGFGGCTVALVRTAAAEEISQNIAAGYEQRTGLKPACFTTRPGGGARILR
jgi:galactokinase